MGTVALTIGRLLVVLSVIMSIPGIMAEFNNGVSGPFLGTALATAVCGGALWLYYRHTEIRVTPRTAFFLTGSVWLVISLVSAIPLLMISHIHYVDAMFETVSAITTTGSTVLVGLDETPPSLLLWRSLLQWLGGLGFIVMSVALMPVLGVGGMRLFKSESSDWTDKSMPRVQGMAGAITSLYVSLTALCALSYFVFGMDVFDAINHSMTTLSTGGFSTHDRSFEFFETLDLQVVAVIFMLLGSLPFSLVVRTLRGRRDVLFYDEQVRGFLLFVVLMIAAMFTWLALTTDRPRDVALVQAAFAVVSVVTTTGFVSDDYGSWGSFAFLVFFYLMFVGGCSGSTAGAMKIFRFQLAYRLYKAQMLSLVHPRGIFRLRYNNVSVRPEIVRSLVGFSVAFFAIIAVSAIGLSTMGLDPITSLTAAITATTNVGPGLGPIVGPVGNFSGLPDAAKWVLSLDMLLGRLEIMPITVLMLAHFWRD